MSRDKQNKKNCVNCIHNLVCEKLEEFRDPLHWVNTKGEFCCSYYDDASDVAEEIFAEIEKLTASTYNDFMFNRDGIGMATHYVVQFSDELDLAIAELKKKYTEEGK